MTASQLWFKRPMLSAAATSDDLANLTYPVFGSPKLDGIRCICHPELGPVTRSFKPIPNEWIRKELSKRYYQGMDGEIITQHPIGSVQDCYIVGDFNTTQSDVMTRSGSPMFMYYVFDYVPTKHHANIPFSTRLDLLRYTINSLQYCASMLEQVTLHDERDVADYAATCIEKGYEGIVLRDPKGAYKYGRSTLKQQGMVKYKEFADAEGVVKDFEELYHNQNPQERDNFGLAKRSDEKDGMVPANTLGALVLETSWGTLSVGSGFDLALRDQIWQNRERYLGKTVTFKYQPYGMRDLPRFPVFMRFREAE